MKKGTVFVGMSGGVDSSVTAALLRDKGYRVVGVHLRCWNVDGCAEQDAEDARRAAEALNIPFYVFDFEKEYKERVVSYMVEGYKKGITPNPDVMCNQEIKFGLFYKRAMSMGADYVATGHYIKLKKKAKAFSLYAAKDKTKDQSYFLWTLTQEQLAHCLFPLGDLIKKTDVRRLAKRYQLPNAEKKDSQGVCFLGHISLDSFLADFMETKPGKVFASTGELLGEHKGAQLYTIGQRKGVGVGGSVEPLYVAAKDIEKNILVMAKENDPALYKSEVALSSVNTIQKLEYGKEYSVWVRVRYRQPLFEALLSYNKEGVMLRFKKPQKFVAEGQSAVIYGAKEEMLGGGVIIATK